MILLLGGGCGGLRSRAAFVVVSEFGFDSRFWFDGKKVGGDEYLHILIDGTSALQIHASAEVSHLDSVGKPRLVGRLEFS
jgi:hypothetical protein